MTSWQENVSRYWPCVSGIHEHQRIPLKMTNNADFDVLFDVSLNKPLKKQSSCWWYETPSRSFDVTVGVTADADALAPDGTGPSAGTMMTTKFFLF